MVEITLVEVDTKTKAYTMSNREIMSKIKHSPTDSYKTFGGQPR